MMCAIKTMKTLEKVFDLAPNLGFIDYLNSTRIHQSKTHKLSDITQS